MLRSTHPSLSVNLGYIWILKSVIALSAYLIHKVPLIFTEYPWMRTYRFAVKLPPPLQHRTTWIEYIKEEIPDRCTYVEKKKCYLDNAAIWKHRIAHVRSIWNRDKMCHAGSCWAPQKPSPGSSPCYAPLPRRVVPESHMHGICSPVCQPEPLQDHPSHGGAPAQTV